MKSDYLFIVSNYGGERVKIINKVMVFVIISLVLLQISCSEKDKSTIIQGTFSFVIVRSSFGSAMDILTGKNKRLEMGILTKDEVYLLDLSSLKNCDDERMKKEPQEGLGQIAGIQLKNGEIIYFISNIKYKYEIRGVLGSLEEAKIVPSDQENKKYFLLYATKVKLLNNS